MTVCRVTSLARDSVVKNSIPIIIIIIIIIFIIDLPNYHKSTKSVYGKTLSVDGGCHVSLKIVKYLLYAQSI